MTPRDLSRLEQQIGLVLRVGVRVSAVLLAAGLVLALTGYANPAPWLTAGLILLMAIPVTRIVASLVDAVRRRDALLASATAIVLLVMLVTLLWSLRSS